MLITAKEIINKSIGLYKTNFQLFLKYMLLLFAPTAILSIAATMIGSIPQTVTLYGLMSTPSIINGLIIIICSIISLWISIAFVRTVADCYENRGAKNIKDELQAAIAVIIPVILMSILASLIILGGTLLVLVPGIIFAVWFAFYFYAIVLDNQKGLSSLHASKHLVKGRWFAVLWRLLAPGMFFALIIIVFQGFLGYVFDIILKNISFSAFSYIFIICLLALLNALITVLVTPLGTAAPTILYLELKKTPLESHPPTELSKS